ncbi:MAG: transglycosylase family protein [Patulibacter sp.]
MRLSRTSPRPLVLLLALVALLAAVLGVLVFADPGQSAPSAGELRDRIERQRQEETRLSGTAGRLQRVEERATKAADAAQRRLDDAQAELDGSRGRLESTTRELREARADLVRLRKKLERSREVLADVLRSRYLADPPDLVDVVIEAKGFDDLLERVEFLRRVQNHDTKTVAAVRNARTKAAADEQRLTRLRRAHERQTAEAEQQRDGIATMAAGLQQRKAEATRAASARRMALRDTRAGRQNAERELSRLVAAERKRAQEFSAPASAAPRGGGQQGTGGWAIPWAIVQCESGGVNHRPNSAGASGYYQFIPQTWQALGGSTPHAYQASRAEQDRMARKLWAGGAGAGNWDCAAMVGISG